MDWRDRQLRRIELVRRGWTSVSGDAALRERARVWLDDHPAGWGPVQEVWTEALEGRGELARWLDHGADPDDWSDVLPLHSVLSAHPFACLPRWSNPRTSSGS